MHFSCIYVGTKEVRFIWMSKRFELLLCVSEFSVSVKTTCLHTAIDDHRLHVEDTLYILFTAMELYSSMEISGNESFVHPILCF